jgi:hypothetical protein
LGWFFDQVAVVTEILAERLGSGEAERKTLLTRQIAFEPLLASVLFAFGWSVKVHEVMARCVLQRGL